MRFNREIEFRFCIFQASVLSNLQIPALNSSVTRKPSREKKGIRSAGHRNTRKVLRETSRVKMTEKRIFDACSTMKNWTSYVLNTVSSCGHEGWRGLKFDENLSARSACDHDSKRCWVDNESNSFILSEYGNEFFVIFTRDVSSVSSRVDLVQKREWRQIGWSWVEAMYNSDARYFIHESMCPRFLIVYKHRVLYWGIV